MVNFITKQNLEGAEVNVEFGETGESDGERKSTGRDPRVLPRTIVYDPDLTLTLPAAVSAEPSHWPTPD